MVLEFLTPVAGWALGKTADLVWEVATNQVQTTLQQTDVEQAIKAGLEATRAWEETLPVADLVFKSCDDRQKRQFLDQAFCRSGVVEQLQQPLTGQGEPDINLLIANLKALPKT
jgi:hypothetical protein